MLPEYVCTLYGVQNSIYAFFDLWREHVFRIFIVSELLVVDYNVNVQRHALSMGMYL